MFKKISSFLTLLSLVLILTISTIIASDVVINKSADQDDPDMGSIIPSTIHEYV